MEMKDLLNGFVVTIQYVSHWLGEASKLVVTHTNIEELELLQK